MTEDTNTAPALSEAAVAELKSRYGNTLISVNAPNGLQVVLRRPPKAVWAEFVEGVSRDKSSKTACMDRLFLECGVHPDRQSLTALLSEYPAFSASVSGELSKLAGASDDLDVKKL